MSRSRSPAPTPLRMAAANMHGLAEGAVADLVAVPTCTSRGRDRQPSPTPLGDERGPDHRPRRPIRRRLGLTWTARVRRAARQSCASPNHSSTDALRNTSMSLSGSSSSTTRSALHQLRCSCHAQDPGGCRVRVCVHRNDAAFSLGAGHHSTASGGWKSPSANLARRKGVRSIRGPLP